MDSLRFPMPELAEMLLLDAIDQYNKEGQFSTKMTCTLYSMFGNIFIEGLELWDSGKFVEYRELNGVRSLFKLRRRYSEYYLFDDVNYCFCEYFQQVLQNQTNLTCSHVLGLRFSRMAGSVPVVHVTGSQLSQMLNDLID